MEQSTLIIYIHTSFFKDSGIVTKDEAEDFQSQRQ